MKKLQFMAWPKLCSMLLLGAAALFTVSCAKDGYDDDEKWETSVRNTQLVSPAADAIEIIPSADGMSMTIKWPVVQGAGGYLVNLLDVSDPANPTVILSKVVDGCSVESVPREDDMSYQLQLRTLGNAALGNIEATTTTHLAFSTFTPTTATIPAGSDLAAWFTANPIAESEDMQYYDLVAGGSYTLNSKFDFQGHKVTLRSQSKNNRPTVTYGAEGELTIGNGFGLKYINFECAQGTKPFISLSLTPGVEPDPDHNNHHIITEPVAILNCNVNNLNSYFLYDGGSDGKKYCLKTVLVNNCVVKLTPSAAGNIGTEGSTFDMYKAGGFICDITIQNSTFWNASRKADTDPDFKYFIRYANAGRPDRAGFASGSINFINCTLYNISKKGQMCNHSGYDGSAMANYNVTKNIFAECGSSQVARRIIGRAGTGNIIFNYNTYVFDGKTTKDDGTCVDQSGYDKGIILLTEPGFADPDNGNFTISGAEQLANQSGDPRWLPLN